MKVKEGTTRFDLLVYCALQNLLNDKLNHIPTTDLNWFTEDTGPFVPISRKELEAMVNKYQQKTLEED